MRIGKSSLSGHQLADLLVLVGLASFVLWYLVGTYNASSHILNLILVLPITLIALALCLFEFAWQLLGGRPSEESDQPEPVRSVAPVISLFAVYVLTLKWLGFDVGTALFVSAFLWLHGERRLRWNVGYAICFAVLVSLLFARALPYPMPLLVLPSAY
jgi:hypothetical protein